MAPTPTCDLIEKKAASRLCYKTHLCYIYSKKKKTLSLYSTWEVLLPSHEIPCQLAFYLWLLGNPAVGYFQINTIKNLMPHENLMLHHLSCLCCCVQEVCSGSNFSLQALLFIICIVFDEHLFDLKWQLPHLLLLWTFGLYAGTWQV